MDARCSSLLGILGTSLTAFTPPSSLPATSNFDYAIQVPTTQEPGRCRLDVEYRHRWLGCHEGYRKYRGYSGARGCLRRRQQYPHNDQSKIRSGFLLTDCGLKYAQEDINNQGDYVELGLACANVCNVLNRGLEGKRSNDLNDSVHKAIEELKE